MSPQTGPDVCGTHAAAGRSVPEHRALVRALLPRPGTETVGLAHARGRVLAADVRAATPMPAFDSSAMDGFAVPPDVLERLAAGPVQVGVAAETAAGDEPVALPAGTVHQIMTGAAVGAGTAAVVPVELTSGYPGPGGTVELRAAVRPGANLRRRGEDIAAGAVVVPAGAVLDASRLGALAALGAQEVEVRTTLRVLVVATGAELARPGESLRPGRIHESNAVMLAAALEALGCVAATATVSDEAGALRDLLDARAPQVDLVVTCGGISAGTHEVVRDTLRDSELVRVAMRPGGPQGLGRWDGVPVVSLPGNPVAALVAFEVLLAPGLREVLGHPAPRHRPAAPAVQPTRRAGTWQYVMAVTAADGTSRELGHGRSGSVAALAGVDHLLAVPPLEDDSPVLAWDLTC